MVINTLTYVGGPYDGQLKVRDTLDDEPVFGPPTPSQPDGARQLGRYQHGTGANRGKMIWRPADA